MMYALHGSGTFVHVASGIHVATFGKFKRKNVRWKWLWVEDSWCVTLLVDRMQTTD